ncbi:hypothetical protein [Paenisporosarcina sp.]|uniref:hypothetical protein n=1 Tax=Paenisporosarcina sp. TaxID=1932001 RepID=UPI003C731927
MKHLILIVLFALLGYFLFILGPVIGGCIAFGIIVGCLFRGISLLTEINSRLVHLTPSPSIDSDNNTEKEGTSHHLKDKDAYLKYLKQKNNPI